MTRTKHCSEAQPGSTMKLQRWSVNSVSVLCDPLAAYSIRLASRYSAQRTSHSLMSEDMQHVQRTRILDNLYAIACTFDIFTELVQHII